MSGRLSIRYRVSSPPAISRQSFATSLRPNETKRHPVGAWGHVIKTGVGPALIQLMERGFVSAIAANGAAMIHDFEIGLIGATSEDVDEAIGPGRFGMADETGRVLNELITQGAADGLGIGQAVSRFSEPRPPPFCKRQRACGGARLDIP